MKRCIADYTSTSLHGFAYFVLHPSFKRSFFVGKNSNLFYYLRFVLRNHVKSYYYFATMQLGSIINYKEESLLHFLTLGYKKHCKLHRKSGLTFYLGGWFMKNVTITFSVPKSIYGFPIILSFDVHFNKRRKCWKFAAVLSNYDSAVFQLCFS